SYTIWLTLDGLSSDQVAGMGLVATDSEGNLLPQPGRVHVNYLITFRRTTRPAPITALAPRKLGCYPGWRAWQSPLNQNGVPNDQSCD
ncbi:MAG: hypothetical protein Q8O07_06595, partial [Chloroflexota bacterium]|nr:hypothetical protein [Chloroflexota bacterium]